MLAAFALWGGAALSAADAHACTLQADGLLPEFETSYDVPIPAGGAWAFRASLFRLPILVADLSITAQTPDGVPVPGQMHIIGADGNLVTTDALAPAPNYLDYLITWAPDEPFTEETPLQLTVRQQPGDPQQVSREFIEEQIDVIFGGQRLPDDLTATPDVTVDELRTQEIEADYQCCRDPMASDSCADHSCWATRYAYVPTIRLALQDPAEPGGRQFYHILTTSNDQRLFLWNQGRLWGGNRDDYSVNLTYPEDSCEASCFTLTTYALNTGEQVAESNHCVQPDEFPEYTPRELTLTGNERPDTCVGDDFDENPEKQTHDRCPRTTHVGPPTTDTPDAGTPDAEMPNAEMPDTATTDTDGADDSEPQKIDDAPMSVDNGCGCASSQGAPGSLLIFALGCGIIIWRRHR